MKELEKLMALWDQQELDRNKAIKAVLECKFNTEISALIDETLQKENQND